MAIDKGGRLVAVAPLERGSDLAMLGDEAADAGRVVPDRGDRDPLLTVARGVVLAKQNRVPVGGDDRATERAVDLAEPEAGVEQRALLVGDRLTERGRQGRTGAPTHDRIRSAADVNLPRRGAVLSDDPEGHAGAPPRRPLPV